LRSTKRDFILEIRNAPSGIELARACHGSLRDLQPPGERMARSGNVCCGDEIWRVSSPGRFKEVRD